MVDLKGTNPSERFHPGGQIPNPEYSNIPGLYLTITTLYGHGAYIATIAVSCGFSPFHKLPHKHPFPVFNPDDVQSLCQRLDADAVSFEIRPVEHDFSGSV